MIIAKRPRRYATVNDRTEAGPPMCCISCFLLRPRLVRSTTRCGTRPTQVQTETASPVSAPRCSPSQRSLHNAPIFRLLLKVAVNGTHQCDFSNFCGAYGSQLPPSSPPATKPRAQWLHRPGMHKPTSLQAAWRLPNQALRRLVFVLT